MPTYDDLTPDERADLFAALIPRDRLADILRAAQAPTPPDARTLATGDDRD